MDIISYHLLQNVIRRIKIDSDSKPSFQSIQNIYGECRESLQTVKEVPSCPSTGQEWRRRAELMRCPTVKQSCGERKDFVYHCLPNAFWNKTLEVCALKRQIVLCE
jgi:hypothetical protein